MPSDYERGFDRGSGKEGLPAKIPLQPDLHIQSLSEDMTFEIQTTAYCDTKGINTLTYGQQSLK